MSVAIVTGASQGLGRAVAERLATQGFTVLAVARTASDLAEAVAQIRDLGGSIHAFAADVSDPEAAARIAGRAHALGPVEVLIHAASTLGPVPLRPALDLRPEDLDAVLATNVTGPFRLTRAVAGAMALHGRGTIAFVSSDAAVEAYPHWGAYGLSKAAADQFARTLAAELGPRGVRVFSIDPGEMDTRMHRDAIPDADPATLADPRDIGTRVVAALATPALAPNGSRVSASRIEVRS